MRASTSHAGMTLALQVLMYMREEGIGFAAAAVDSGKALSFVQKVGAAFFRLTMHEKQLFAAHVPADCQAPPAFKRFCGFSQYDRPGTHKKRPQLGQNECKAAAIMLRALVADYSWTCRAGPRGVWQFWRQAGQETDVGQPGSPGGPFMLHPSLPAQCTQIHLPIYLS